MHDSCMVQVPSSYIFHIITQVNEKREILALVSKHFNCYNIPFAQLASLGMF